MRLKLTDYTPKDINERLGQDMETLLSLIISADAITNENFPHFHELREKNNECDICFLEATVSEQIGHVVYTLCELVERRMNNEYHLDFDKEDKEKVMALYERGFREAEDVVH